MCPSLLWRLLMATLCDLSFANISTKQKKVPRRYQTWCLFCQPSTLLHRHLLLQLQHRHFAARLMQYWSLGPHWGSSQLAVALIGKLPGSPPIIWKPGSYTVAVVKSGVTIFMAIVVSLCMLPATAPLRIQQYSQQYIMLQCTSCSKVLVLWPFLKQVVSDYYFCMSGICTIPMG